jgi:hypothetical protein
LRDARGTFAGVGRRKRHQSGCAEYSVNMSAQAAVRLSRSRDVCSSKMRLCP